MSNKKKDGRGGAREGTGPKKLYETKAKKIPVAIEPAVDALIFEYKKKFKK